MKVACRLPLEAYSRSVCLIDELFDHDMLICDYWKYHVLEIIELLHVLLNDAMCIHMA